MSEEITNTPGSPSREERINKLAYQLWEEEGRPEGRSDDHWFRASAMIDAEDQEQAGTSAEPLPSYLSRLADDMPGSAIAEPVEAKKATTKEPSLEELTRRMKSRSAA